MVDFDEIEECPEGYNEVLAQCTVLAANLLKMLIDNSATNRTETCR
jgi:hypothetical protein